MSDHPTPRAASDSEHRRTPPTQADASERTRESLTIGVAVAAFGLVALAAVAAFRLDAAPISGEGSVGQFAAVSSAIVAIAVFLLARYVVMRAAVGRPRGVLAHLDILALALAHGIIALLSWTLLANLLEDAFIDAQVFPLAVIVLAGATASLTGYVVFVSAIHMDLDLLAVVLAVFLVEGVLASMLTASDPHWWQENLSALGMTDDLSAMAFNLTLIVAGFIVTTLARYATSGIPSSDPRGVTKVRTCLLIVGVFLALVGVFPVDQFFFLHTAVASGMAVAFGVLVFGIRRWMPELPSTFLTLGYLFLGVIVVLAVMFIVGTYTLTAVELVAGVLVFTWIILFIRSAAAVGRDASTQIDTSAGG